jgi:hypothetical protein
MSHAQKPQQPSPEWKRRGWKSEEEWKQAQARVTAQHQRAAAALGIPWRVK